jgi:hypothetical protein
VLFGVVFSLGYYGYIYYVVVICKAKYLLLVLKGLNMALIFFN